MVEFRVPILTRLGQDGPETLVVSTSLRLIALESIEQGTICERENLQGSFLGVGGVRLSYLLMIECTFQSPATSGPFSHTHRGGSR